MGRVVRRVPLDFDWPLNYIWEGFLNPYWEERQECEACEGSGYSSFALHWKKMWYGDEYFEPSMTGSTPFRPTDEIIIARAERTYKSGWSDSIDSEAIRLTALFNSRWCHHLDQDDVNALVEGNRLWDFTRRPLTTEQEKLVPKGSVYLPASNGYHPTAQEVNQWSLFSWGHDSTNSWICIRFRCVRNNEEEKCSVCGGSGDLWTSPEAEKAYDEWLPTEPPLGEGYQLWEDVTEGSPISRVFPTADAFVRYLSNECGYSETAAKNFVEDGWAPSFMVVSGGKDAGVYKDIEAHDVLKEQTDD